MAKSAFHGSYRMMDKIQIAIDTSTETASLAVVQGPEILVELTWHCGQNHTVELFSRLDNALDKAGREIGAADIIFVAKGPGSFNGLRVGVAAAKGLAYTLGIPIIGVSTLEVLAYPHAAMGLPVCAIQKAGREEIAAAIYQRKPRLGWTQSVPEHLTTIKALKAEIKENSIICGEFEDGVAVEIKRLLRGKAVIPAAAARLRRAGFLAALGQIKSAAGKYDDIATLQPIYLRRPPITERKKK
jgi:tRNA threonylcarbamoyladenosine biosynthesis protein TsaB